MAFPGSCSGQSSYLLESLSRLGLTTQEPLLAVNAYPEALHLCPLPQQTRTSRSSVYQTPTHPDCPASLTPKGTRSDHSNVSVSHCSQDSRSHCHPGVPLGSEESQCLRTKFSELLACVWGHFSSMALYGSRKCWYDYSNFLQFVPDKEFSSKLSWLLFFCSKMLVNTISLINLSFYFITEN